mmetsp:Transcript_3590/g.7724  ORF Transcript_3590/g.7724 Transcript_3590/m.7724 type:complete len:294 (+) Transcript_3590:1235-2116(+)
MARLELTFESSSHIISPLPISLTDLQQQVRRLFPVQDFTLSYGSVGISSTRDLLVAYLNNTEDVLTLSVQDDVKPMSYLDGVMVSLMTRLVEDSEKELEASGTFPYKFCNQLLDEAEHVTKRISKGVANSFQDERLRFYKVDNETYRNVVFDQIRTLALLQANTVGEVLRKHAADPEVFRRSLDAYSADLKHRLEHPDDTPMSETLPEGLDKQRFREMLEYSSSFTLGYLAERGVLDEMEYALLKVLEADEMYQKFGYRESDINLAFKEFDFEGSPEWDDIKERLSQVKLASI